MVYPHAQWAHTHWHCAARGTMHMRSPSNTDNKYSTVHAFLLLHTFTIGSMHLLTTLRELE